MNLEQIREAVRVMERANTRYISEDEPMTYKQAWDIVLDTCRQVLAVGGVMPKKKVCPEKGDNEHGDACLVCLFYEDINEAIDDCTLSITRKLVGLENVIDDSMRKETGIKEAKHFLYTDNLAQAIREHMTK